MWEFTEFTSAHGAQRFVQPQQAWGVRDSARMYLLVALLCAPNSTAVRAIVAQLFEPEGLAHTCCAHLDRMPQSPAQLMAVSEALRVAQAMSNHAVQGHRQQILEFARSLVARLQRWFGAASEAQVKALPAALIGHIADQCCQLGAMHGDSLGAVAEACVLPALQCNAATEDPWHRATCVDMFARLLQGHGRTRIASWICSPECLQLLLRCRHPVPPQLLQGKMPMLFTFISVLAGLHEDHFSSLLAGACKT